VTLPGGNGGSANPVSDVYWGTAPFSEPETQVIRDFALANPQIRWHHDIHGYGQLLLHPWGYTSVPSPAHATFSALGQRFQLQIVAVNKLAYTPGIMYASLYPVSGGITDWFYAQQGVHAFLFELRGNPGGFVLPPEYIVPNCEEVFPAILYAARWTADQFSFRADFDGDCLYTSADFGAFQAAYAVGDPRADLNGDGLLNLADFGSFQTAFSLRR
jgi:hypothetical protein